MARRMRWWWIPRAACTWVGWAEPGTGRLQKASAKCAQWVVRARASCAAVNRAPACFPHLEGCVDGVGGRERADGVGNVVCAVGKGHRARGEDLPPCARVGSLMIKIGLWVGVAGGADTNSGSKWQEEARPPGASQTRIGCSFVTATRPERGWKRRPLITCTQVPPRPCSSAPTAPPHPPAGT